MKISTMGKAGAVLAALAGVALFPAASSAHHSTAMFEWGKSVELKHAKVLKWEWTNPHTFLYVTAPRRLGQGGALGIRGHEPQSPLARRLGQAHAGGG